MGTKSKPGEFDCYEAAAPDEPMFVLLARDDSAPERVEEWARKRFERAAERLACASLARTGGQCVNDGRADQEWLGRELRKIAEALTCATAMREWKRKKSMPILMLPEEVPYTFFGRPPTEMCDYPGCSCGGLLPKVRYGIDYDAEHAKLVRDRE